MVPQTSLTAVLGQRALLLFLLLTLAPRSLCTDDHITEPTVKSVFDAIGPSFKTLIDQILEIEDMVCANTRGSGTACSKCYNDSLCAVYHDCCPDLVFRENITYEEQFVECEPLTLFPIRRSYQWLKMKSGCPRSANESHISELRGAGLIRSLLEEDVTKCENPNVTILHQAVPVSSQTTGLIYKNQFCAACHEEVTNLTMWESSIHCHYTLAKLVSMAKTKLEMFHILMSRTGVDAVSCELRFIPPEGSRVCYPRSQEIISSCNVSGQWDLFDIRLERACHMYTSIFSNIYKNMFCYLCNQGDQFSLMDLVMFVGAKKQPIVMTSYSALLDFRDDILDDIPDPQHDSSFSECSENQFYDTVNCACRTPSCSWGKFLTQDGRCHSILNTNFLGYRLCAQVVLETDPPLNDPKSVTSISLNSTRLILELNISVTSWCPGNKRIHLDLAGKILEDDKKEQKGFSTLEHLESEIQRLFFENQTIFANANWKIKFYQFTLVSPCPEIPVESSPCLNNKNVTMAGVFYKKPAKEVLFNDIEVHFIDFIRITPCPFVYMSLSNLSLEAESQRYVYPITNNSIDVADVHVVNQSEVWLCTSDYKLLTSTDNLACMPNTDSKTSQLTWTVPGLISLVCTCISLLCLFLTFLTYVSLPQLRSGGGENIITLIVTLFIAQALYEFLVEQHENGTLCTVFGIAIHYSWLVAVFSMNACTVERYMKLCHPFTSRIYFMSKKPILLSTAYTFIGPLIIVVANVTANMLAKDNLGYGSPHLCYINTLVARVAAFAVPVGIIVVVNLCLLVVIFCKVNKHSRQEKGRNTQIKIGLVACVRLSSVTGFTWLLLFMHEAFPHPVLENIVSALFGLLGVLLFFSLVLNKQLMSLLFRTYPVLRQGVGLCNCRAVCCPRYWHPATPTTSTSGTQSSNLIPSNDYTLTELNKSSTGESAVLRQNK